jgi:LuxR family maltose regulon positive regulatory protein
VRPPIPDRLIVRDRVLRELDKAGDVAVVFLEAPGGYGKTTALAQWLDQDPRPVVWVSVRPAAPDAPWVAQAIVDGAADAGLVADRPVLTGSPGPMTWHLDTLPLLEELLAAIAEPFVVVVDDAGAITGTAWDCLVESIAVSLPPGAQLLLTTREAMPAPLSRLQSRGQVAVIGRDVLAFDEAETRTLLQALGGVPTTEQVRTLVRQTEGWPVAVYLEGLAMTADAAARRRAGSPITARLTQYLRAEVIGRLSEDDARFLSRVSVLDTLDEESCDVVTGTSGALERLRRLSGANHLLAPQDLAAERFRMHPLLSEALERQLREVDPVAWRSAHASASLAEARRGNYDSAVHHAKAAHDDRRLSDLVWSRAPTLLASGRFAVLDRWLAGLDDSRVGQHCGLALSAAWLASHQGDMARLNRMALVVAQRAAHEDPGFVLDSDLLAATIGAGGLDRIEVSARAFIAAKPVDDPWQTLAHFLLGVALFLRDEPAPAVASLGESHRIAVAHDLPVMSAHALAGLADIAFEEGEAPRALSLIREARELAARHRLDTITTTGPVFTTSAVGYMHEGRYADARREATRALRLTAGMRWVAPWHAVQGRLALAQVFAALGEPERARVLADEAADASGPTTASPRLERLAEETRERLSAVSASLEGQSSLTTAEIRVLQFLPTHLTFAQIADELFVSRHTVKTQALSTYRKLGVHTRTEAIASARRAGLLPPR